MKKRQGLKAEPAAETPDWNVLASPWLEVVDLRGRTLRCSPIDALANASKIHRIVSPNPLDVFAAHRFLLTLLYWVAGDAKKTQLLRRALLRGKLPDVVLKRLLRERDHFHLFDRKVPFLQDPAVASAKESTPAYLFAEMAAGTNVAHFHHGHDDSTSLCLRCATLGLVRLVPWTQSGGAGKTPSIHNAPPIMPLAIGKNLAETLGLNLFPLNIPQGKAQWSGHFRPSSSRVKLMEGLTWNPRRVHLLEPQPPGLCSRCGEASLPTVGPIVFEKNEACKKDDKRVWRDPAAFYSLKDGVPFATVKSGKESIASTGGDLRNLFERTYGKKVEPAPSSLVIEANSGHCSWWVVVPCTNPANNKSYDHRAVWFEGFDGDAPKLVGGWPTEVVIAAGDPRAADSVARVSTKPSPGVAAFVRAASTLDAVAWSLLGTASSMEDDSAAFDVFTSIYWPLRSKHASLPCKPAAWLALKLMASAGRFRPSTQRAGKFRPWEQLKSHQPESKTRDGKIRQYPRAIPRGDVLETEMRQIIRKHASSKSTTGIDWPSTCQFLHEVLSQ